VFGLELSIPLLIVSVVQALGLGVHVFFDTRITKKGLITNKALLGVLILAFNGSRLLNGFQHSDIDALFFAFTCGFLSTLFLESAIKTQRRFVLVLLFNTTLFGLILALTYRIQGIFFFDRMLLLAGVLNVYYAIIGILTYIQISKAAAHKTKVATLTLVVASVIIAFTTLLSEEQQMNGLFTMNYLFVLLVFLDLAKKYVFNDHETDKAVSENQDIAPLQNELKGQGQVADTTVENSNLNTFKESLDSYDLTARQKEVAELLLQRLTVNEISEKLNITDKTLSTHCTAIYAKTETVSRYDLILKFKVDNSGNQTSA